MSPVLVAVPRLAAAPDAPLLAVGSVVTWAAPPPPPSAETMATLAPPTATTAPSAVPGPVSVLVARPPVAAAATRGITWGASPPSPPSPPTASAEVSLEAGPLPPEEL